MNIIDWSKINTFRGWGRVFAWICHPIEMYKCEKCYYGTIVWKINKFFEDSWKRLLPFAKPCRWLGSTLVNRVTDSKLLDTFYCRTCGKDTKYYKATCCFGWVKFVEISHTYKNKPVNLFLDITVAALAGDKNVEKKTKKIVTKTKVLYAGFVFTKKQAQTEAANIILNNPTVYKRDYINPLLNMPYAHRTVVQQSRNVLFHGKFLDNENELVGDEYLSGLFKASKDNIEKLLVYTLYLLSCRNQFNAREMLLEVKSECEHYIFAKRFKQNPTVDGFYVNLKKRNKKAAEDYVKTQNKTFKNIKKETLTQINTLLQNQELKYCNEELKYYRV